MMKKLPKFKTEEEEIKFGKHTQLPTTGMSLKKAGIFLRDQRQRRNNQSWLI